MLAPLKLGSLELPSQLIVAPMAGVTDYPFRVVAREFGAGLVYCEFVSSEGVIREQKRAYDLMRFQESERPIGIQIFGANPEVMHRSAAMIVEEHRPDILDINFGCPVPKVAKKGGGAAALKDLGLMQALTTAVVEAAGTTPVSVKMRAGWTKETLLIPDVAPMLESCGICALTLHPRFSQKKYVDPANWSLIKATKESVTIPVIGNGDVFSVDDLERMLETTGCDGVMIGRAALGNPWVVHDMVAWLAGETASGPPSALERLRVCERHLVLEIEESGEHRGLNRMRKQFGWYLSRHRQTKPIVSDLVRVREANDALALIRSLRTQLHAGKEPALAA